MRWVSGTWGEVAIGDDVLGGDGYAWLVTDGAISRFGVSGVGELLSVTMQRDGAGSRTGDVLASKPVKYRATEVGGRYLLSCVYCLRGDESEPCKLHAPEPADVAARCWPACSEMHTFDGGCLLKREPAPATPHAYEPSYSGMVCGAMVELADGTGDQCGKSASDPVHDMSPRQYDAEGRDKFNVDPVACDVPSDAPVVVEPREQVYTELATLRAEAVEAKRERALAELANPTPPKPFVEYDDADRAAAAALKGAGFEMTVIERTLTLDGLIDHLRNVHGDDYPRQKELTRIEYRAKLADLHFELHEHDQERGKPWTPRGRTPHVHPVMDRPMEDAKPKSLRR